MNWLAHLFLSEPTPAYRVGSLLPDFVSATKLAQLPPAFQPGIDRHRQIDRFTDSHPVVRRSVQRFEPPYRRFGGVLTDMFYDHVLAREWDSFSSVPLPAFATEVYLSFEQCRSDVPPEMYAALERMRDQDWLCSYGEVGGISEALERMGRRLRRPVDLAGSISVLEQNYDAFRADFRAFFPELFSHVAPGWTMLESMDSPVPDAHPNR